MTSTGIKTRREGRLTELKEHLQWKFGYCVGRWRLAGAIWSMEYSVHCTVQLERLCLDAAQLYYKQVKTTLTSHSVWDTSFLVSMRYVLWCGIPALWVGTAFQPRATSVTQAGRTLLDTVNQAYAASARLLQHSTLSHPCWQQQCPTTQGVPSGWKHRHHTAYHAEQQLA